MYLNSKRNILVDKAKTHLWIISAGLLALSFFSTAFAQEDLTRTYSIKADFRHIEKRNFPIEMDAVITNRTQSAIPNLAFG